MKTIFSYIRDNSKLFLVQIIGPFFGLISFLLYTSSFYLSGQTENIDYPFGITISLAITLILNIPGTVLLINENQEKYSNETLDTLSKVEHRIEKEARSFRHWNEALLRERFKISLVDAEDTASSIKASLQNSNSVKNTFVNLRHLTGSNTQEGLSLVQIYSEYLNRGPNVKWVDITGVEDFLDGRYHKISDLVSSGHGVHELNLISDSLPILNFMIIGNSGDFKEVYFGWLKNDSTFADIYYSTDSRMVELFNKYFSLLLNYRKDYVSVDYAKPKTEIFKSLIIEQIRGNWLSVSTSNSIKLPENYSKFSIINISVEDGKWIVVGRVFERKTNKIIHEIKCLSASIFEDGIFYRFERTDADSKNIVRGHGTFSVTASFPDIVTGIYIAQDDRKRPVHNMRAIKIDGGTDGRIDAVERFQADKLIEQIQNSINRKV